MGLKDIDYLYIGEDLRLAAYRGQFEFAYSWYQDIESLKLIDGEDDPVPYTYERLKIMYEYLDLQGELFFIELKENNKFRPIGDVTFSGDDMPIVIDKAYRSIGVGSRVIKFLVSRAKKLGYEKLIIGEIYDYNLGSKALFEKNGFKAYKKTSQGSSYVLYLNLID